jgi:hypothetical protein
VPVYGGALLGVSRYGPVVSLVTVVTVVCASAIGEAAVSAAIKAEVRTSKIMAFPRALMKGGVSAREKKTGSGLCQNVLKSIIP